MKFAEHLNAHITPEWRKQYINYDEMKVLLYQAVEEAPSAETVEQEEVTRHFTKFDETFFNYCDKELLKINNFYSEKLAEATRKFASLCSELSLAIEQKEGGKTRRKADVPARKISDLKLAFSEFYLSLVLLQSYQNLNYTGFRKILKKHDKLLSVDLGAKYQSEHVESAHFYTNQEIPRLIQETETTVIQDLEGGNRQKAMKRLRVPPLGEQQSPWTTFKVGLFSGSFVVLFIAAVLSAVSEEDHSNLKMVFKLYRGPLLVVQFVFLMGINVYGWRSSGVNHVLIFELDPRKHISEQHLMELAAVMGVVWCLGILSFLNSDTLSIPAYVNPLTLTCIFIILLVNPIHMFHHEARFWCVKVLGRMVSAPFFHVGFADFWLADQLNSLVTVLLDFHFVVCFYFSNASWMQERAVDFPEFSEDYSYLLSRALVNCFPAWIRFAQCLRRYYDSRDAVPHLLNAGKYATTFFVVFFNFHRSLAAKDSYSSTWNDWIFYCWFGASVVSSTYSYIWDIYMDWGLFRNGMVGENILLREGLVYNNTFYYYFAMIEDLALRFFWVVSYWFTKAGYCSNDVMTSLTAVLEVFRRFIWNFFRLENEHLNNCGSFRAVRDISVAPIDSGDLSQIIRMMDEENGVTNRKQRKPTKKLKEDRIPILYEESTTDRLNVML